MAIQVGSKVRFNQFSIGLNNAKRTEYGYCMVEPFEGEKMVSGIHSGNHNDMITVDGYYYFDDELEEVSTMQHTFQVGDMVELSGFEERIRDNGTWELYTRMKFEGAKKVIGIRERSVRLEGMESNYYYKFIQYAEAREVNVGDYVEYVQNNARQRSRMGYNTSLPFDGKLKVIRIRIDGTQKLYELENHRQYLTDEVKLADTSSIPAEPYIPIVAGDIVRLIEGKSDFERRYGVIEGEVTRGEYQISSDKRWVDVNFGGGIGNHTLNTSQIELVPSDKKKYEITYLNVRGGKLLSFRTRADNEGQALHNAEVKMFQENISNVSSISVVEI